MVVELINVLITDEKQSMDDGLCFCYVEMYSGRLNRANGVLLIRVFA